MYLTILRDIGVENIFWTENLILTHCARHLGFEFHWGGHYKFNFSSYFPPFYSLVYCFAKNTTK